jgi:predicted dehydrogenase
MTSKTQVNIGLIGCGIWGQKILRDLLSLQAQIWVIDSDPTKLQIAREMGADKTFLSTPKDHLPDGWIVSTPASTHHDVLMELFPLGKPIYVEKPLTCSAREANQLLEKASVPVFVMHNWRYHRGVQLLTQIAQSKELGELVFMKSNRCNWTSPRSDVDSVWTLIPHDITIAYNVLGYFPEPVLAVVEEYHGVQRGMTAFLGKNPACVMEVSNRYADKRREIRLHFTKGVAVLKNEIVDHIEIYHGDDQSKPEDMHLEIRKFEPIPPLLEELKSFIGYLQGGPPPLTPLEEGVKVIRIIDQLKKLAANQ